MRTKKMLNEEEKAKLSELKKEYNNHTLDERADIYLTKYDNPLEELLVQTALDDLAKEMDIVDEWNDILTQRYMKASPEEAMSYYRRSDVVHKYVDAFFELAKKYPITYEECERVVAEIKKKVVIK